MAAPAPAWPVQQRDPFEHQTHPLTVEIAHSDLLAPILAGAEVFAFVIPAVKFRVLNEWVLTAKTPPADTAA